MWYLWSEEFGLIIDEGCKIQDIVKHSQNILEQVILALSSITIKFDEIISKKQNLMEKANKSHSTFNKVPISIQYSSRHFSPSMKLLSLESDCGFDECSDVDESCLQRTVQSLTHDDNVEITDLILKCWKRQIFSSSCSVFNADGILICPILLPCSSSTVIDGLVIKSYLKYSWGRDMKNTCSNRTLLIKGSITYKYVHLGFSPKVKISVQQTSLTTNKEIWIEKICEFIKELNLDVLLINGDIEPEIVSFCLAHSVLALPHIPVILFKKLCNVLQYSPCTYVMDCTEGDIQNLKIKIWKPKEDVTLEDQYFLINTDSENMAELQTIVLCHPCQAILESTEHQTYHLISRLSLSFKSNTLLPGGGISEEWCFEFLNKLPQFRNFYDPTSRIMKALADGFRNYAILVSGKKSLCTSPVSEILDEMSSKLSAWRSALSLLLLTLQCDTVIINGIDDLNIQNLCVNTL